MGSSITVGRKAVPPGPPDATQIASLAHMARIQALMIRANHMSHPVADRLDELSEAATGLCAEIEVLRRPPEDAEIAAMLARLDAALDLGQDHAAGLLDLGHQVMVREAAALIRRLARERSDGGRRTTPHPACENTIGKLVAARGVEKTVS